MALEVPFQTLARGSHRKLGEDGRLSPTDSGRPSIPPPSPATSSDLSSAPSSPSADLSGAPILPPSSPTTATTKRSRTALEVPFQTLTRSARRILIAPGPQSLPGSSSTPITKPISTSKSRVGRSQPPPKKKRRVAFSGNVASTATPTSEGNTDVLYIDEGVVNTSSEGRTGVLHDLEAATPNTFEDAEALDDGNATAIPVTEAATEEQDDDTAGLFKLKFNDPADEDEYQDLFYVEDFDKNYHIDGPTQPQNFHSEDPQNLGFSRYEW